MIVWKAAIEVLQETGNPAVMWGDEGLLHLIAERLGWPHKAWVTSNRVMAALNRTPGKLIKTKHRIGRYIVCKFTLPEGINNAVIAKTSDMPTVVAGLKPQIPRTFSRGDLAVQETVYLSGVNMEMCVWEFGQGEFIYASYDPTFPGALDLARKSCEGQFDQWCQKIANLL